MSNTTTADREIVITRFFKSSVDRVFEAWTKPEHVIHWWGPDGFTITNHEMVVKPGGMWRFIMHGPDGTNYPNRIVFTKVVKQERLEFLMGPDIDNDPKAIEVTVDFKAQGKGTELTMRMLFTTKEERTIVVEKYGAIEGNRQTMNRLEAYLSQPALQ